MPSSRLTRWCAFGTLISLCALRALADQAYTGDGALPILEHIAKCWEDARTYEEELCVTGTVAVTQEAAKDEIVPANKLFSHGPNAFTYYYKLGKQRYQQQELGAPERTYYAINDKEKIVNYWQDNTVHIESLDKPEAKWSTATGLFGSLSVVEGVAGFETVSSAMRRLIEMQKRRPEDGRLKSLNVRVDEQGIFEVNAEFGPRSQSIFWLDSTKDYNLVKRYTILKGKKFSSEINATMRYEQAPKGEWFLAEAHLDGIENGVHVTKELKIAKRETGPLNLSDDLFDATKLQIPPGIYTEDRRFSPRLVLRDQRRSDVLRDEAILRLAQTPIEPNTEAQVSKDGNIKVVPADIPPPPVPQSDARRYVVASVVAGVALCAIVAFWAIRRQGKGARTQ